MEHESFEERYMNVQESRKLSLLSPTHQVLRPRVRSWGPMQVHKLCCRLHILTENQLKKTYFSMIWITISIFGQSVYLHLHCFAFSYYKITFILCNQEKTPLVLAVEEDKPALVTALVSIFSSLEMIKIMCSSRSRFIKSEISNQFFIYPYVLLILFHHLPYHGKKSKG